MKRAFNASDIKVRTVSRQSTHALFPFNPRLWMNGLRQVNKSPMENRDTIKREEQNRDASIKPAMFQAGAWRSVLFIVLKQWLKYCRGRSWWEL